MKFADAKTNEGKRCVHPEYMNVKRLSVAATLLSLALISQAAGPSSGIKCKLEQVKDSESGLVAFTYFVPQGWTAHSMMQWTAPGAFTANLSASTPDKHYSVSQLQHMVVSYGRFGNNPPKGIVIHHATDFLRALVELLKRQYNVNDVQITDEVNQPVPASQLSSIPQINTSGPMDTVAFVNEVGFLQVSFDADGTPMVAALGTSVSGRNDIKHQPNRPDQEVGESGVFAVGPSTVIVSPANPAHEKVKELQLIASSMNMTPQFLAHWREVTTKLAKATLDANVLGRQYADAHWHEHAMAKFRDQMEAKDANTHQFCNYILNQQDYKDQSGNVVTLPSSYKHAWADGNGNYLLTDDPTTDTRGYGSGSWQEMGKYRPGD